MKISSRNKRTWIVLLAAFVGIWELVSYGMAPILANRLQAMVSSHLNAELRMGTVRYCFPYGVIIEDASLVANDPDGNAIELLHARRVDLSLAKLPIGDGPLVIEKLAITDPMVSINRTANGIIGEFGLIKADSEQANAKLSDMFRLRRFKIDGGQVVYRDQTQPGNLPMVWKNLQIDLTTSPKNGVLYEYNLVARDLPLLKAEAVGTMNLDELFLNVSRFNLNLQVSVDAQQSQLPGVLQELLRKHQIDGQLTLNGTAQVPLHNPGDTRYDAVVDLSKASAFLPQWDASLDRMVLKVRCTSAQPPQLTPLVPLGGKDMMRQALMAPVARADEDNASSDGNGPSSTQPALAPAPPVLVRIELLEAGSGDTVLRVENGVALLDPVGGRWRVAQLAGVLNMGTNRNALPTRLQELMQRLGAQGRLEFTARAVGPVRPTPGKRAIDQIDYELITFARDLTLQAPMCPLPLEHINGSVHLRNREICLENIDGIYGNDKIYLGNCVVPLGNAPRELAAHDLQGSITFGQNPTQYPEVLRPMMEQVRPIGRYFFKGDLSAHDIGLNEPDYHLDYALALSSDDGSALVTTQRIPISHIKLEADLRNGAVDLKKLQASCCEGAVEATGQARMGKVLTYQGRARATGIDLKVLSDAWTHASGDEPMNLSGKASMEMLFSGVGPRMERTFADNFRAKGEFEIIDGDFWQAPVVSDLLANVKLAHKALTVGQAAALFEIYDRKMVLENAAIGSSMLGLQGRAEVRLDGQIEARIVAAPLGDWRGKMQMMNAPGSASAGLLVGKMQKLLNSTSRALLYEFRVSGTVAHTSISTVPVPFLTDAAAHAFGAMLSTTYSDHPIRVIPSNKGPSKDVAQTD